MLQQEDNFAYAAMLKLTGKKCVIVGGGKVAARKLASLAEAGAAVTVVALDFADELMQTAQKYDCNLIRSAYDASFLDDAFITVAATSDDAVNEQITRDAPMLYNNITSPRLSNFTVPSSFSVGDIHVAVATGGMPAYTRLLKQFLRNKLSPDFAEFNSFLQTIRVQLKALPCTPAERTAFWRGALDEKIINLLEAGQIDQAKEQITDAVNSFRAQSQNRPR